MSNNYEAIIQHLSDCATDLERITNAIKDHSAKTPRIGKKSEIIILNNIQLARNYLMIASSYFPK